MAHYSKLIYTLYFTFIFSEANAQNIHPKSLIAYTQMFDNAWGRYKLSTANFVFKKYLHTIIN